ncbi:MAG: FAD-dependent oxidoreductase [Candidatus Omnitrophota bacterium]
MNKKIVILGAGLTGLSTAYHLKNRCFVYEQSVRAGGLVCSYYVDGFIFDCDGHLLHFKTVEAKKLIKKLLPGVLAEHERNTWIYSHNVYSKYPFQANTFGLPSSIIKNCVLGIAKIKSQSKQKENESLKDWMEREFGPGITKHFMYPYNLKFWTVPPEELIPDWTKGYVPLVSVKEVINGAFSAKTKPLGYNSRFWYPKAGGIDQLAQAFSRQLGNLKTRHKASAIDLKKKEVYFKNGRSAQFTQLVSTIPLVELKELIKNDLPGNVKKAFSGLRYISIFNLNLGIDRAKISDKHWIYFPEDKFCFFRVGFPMNFSENVTPKGKSSMYVEISYSDSKPLKKEGITEIIRNDLIKAGILNSRDKILTSQINDIKYGYVLYDHNYKKNIKIIHDFLIKNDVYPAGRYGAWKYMSMEDSVLEGKMISEMINNSG